MSTLVTAELGERAGARRGLCWQAHTLFFASPCLCPHVSEPRLLGPPPSSPLGFSLFLALSFPFLCISGGLSYCPSGSLFLPWVSECVFLLLSISFFSGSLMCLFVLILVSLLLFLSLSACFFLCMSLSFSVYHLFSLSLSTPTPNSSFSVSVSLCLSRLHFLPSCLPGAPCAWPAPTAAGSGERVRSDCPGGHLMD